MSTKIDVLMLCPFCGGAPERQKTQFGQPVMRWINCPQCGASATAYEKQEDAVSAWNHRTYGGAAAELIAELRNAHEIIKLAMHHVPAYARSPWFIAIEDAGLCGDGITRFHERKALLDSVGGVA